MVHWSFNESSSKGSFGRRCIAVGPGYFQRSARDLLGPLLFTIFINVLLGETVGKVRAALYADDAKLYKNVSSVSDCLSLQTTLANLNDWSKGNNINFNTSKCKTLTVTRKKTPLIYEYTLNNKQNLCECLRKKI